jgi:hypothetical protein
MVPFQLVSKMVCVKHLLSGCRFCRETGSSPRLEAGGCRLWLLKRAKEHCGRRTCQTNRWNISQNARKESGLRRGPRRAPGRAYNTGAETFCFAADSTAFRAPERSGGWNRPPLRSAGDGTYK